MNVLGPLPSNYNPTGMDFGVNPNVSGSILKARESLIPGTTPQSNTPQLGVPTGTPFMSPTTAVPSIGSPNVRPTTQFGFPVGMTSPTTAPTNLQSLVPGGGTLDPKLIGALDKTYGKGFGQTVYNVLKQGAGWNPQVANAFMYAVEPYFQKHLNDIMESFGAAGQRFSSTAALAAGEFGASFTAQQQQLFAQMYQWAYGNFLNTLQYGSKNTSGNIFGTLNNILGLVGTGAGALSAAGVGAGSTAGTIISVLAGL
jgi:hypothetical protein